MQIKEHSMHTSLKRKIPATITLAAACAFHFVSFAESVVASAEDAIPVDVRTGECRVLPDCKVAYGPCLGGVTNKDAYVVLFKVMDADKPNAVTDELVRFGAGEAGEYSLAQLAGEESLRLIHCVYSKEGVEIGDTLVRDIVFGSQSVQEGGFVADTRADSLPTATLAREPVALTYSTLWATNADAVAISAIKLSGAAGDELSTNSLFAVQAEAEGENALNLGSGWWRLLYRVTDGSGENLLEYLSSDFKVPYGFMFKIK